MATITVIHHSEFWDPQRRITFETSKVKNEDGHLVFRAVAREVPEDVAREYAERPEHFIVEGLPVAPPVASGLNAKDTIALVEAASADALERLSATEDGREGGPRKGVLAAIDERRAALVPKDPPGDGTQV